ncbi:outer membrane protein assembly factor BamD [Bacteroidetes bacterium endosymbiont of Geopemphigus sp.]|uniref:outer membrane protein assembly factor BamD n=1 Tax=Bacteroidetes bacterium endosymbiont of Geopemphigus sp. TaxID=2047937 RepID=UPI000CD13826|nr:outer membrane protein assembly factor BamD [Bacteroidetes bacterium endosymbiont of Geopemphigus sp.]
MQKKIIFQFFLPWFLILNGCNKELDNPLKSTDVTYIFSQGDAFVSQKKYPQALQLYERAAPMLRGTESAKDLIFKTAMANFYDKNYSLAAHQFKNFHSSYLQDERAEEALFHSAYSYYMSSPDYNLDQSSTYAAIEELQNFINQYPGSKKILEVNTFIQTLTKKLEKKYFEIAKIYHDIMRYKAAVKAFEQLINDFPESPLREKAEYYRLDAQYELAIHSDPSLEKERLEEVLTMVENFRKSYSDSQHKEEIIKIERRVSQNLKHINELSALKK